MTTGRYAIYFAPPRHSPWWEFGAGWLGRDDADDRALAQPRLDGFTEAGFAQLTEAPRRYGFHATLKAPFAPQGDDAGALARAVDQLASQLRCVPLGLIVPVYMDGFVALVPARRAPGVQQVAARCVVDLDALRAPLTSEELARRAPERLDDRGRDLLQRYGYPHVLERFRFHMTLTGLVDTATAGRVVAQVTHPVTQLADKHPLVLDRLCIFHEPSPEAPLRRVHEVELRP